MSLTSLLLYIRDEVVRARRSKNFQRLAELQSTLSVLQEHAEMLHDGPHMQIIDELIDTIADVFHGVEWKSAIPTHADIRRATSH